MSKRAILYARVSTPRQAELFSLDYQLEQERIYADDMGLAVVKEIQDDQSGRKMQRDGLAEARAMLANNQADVLVTWKLDRLHRNFVNSVLLRDELRRLGKELHYAQARIKSGETARERLPEDLQYIMAEIEAEDILERTKMGRDRKARIAQKWVGSNRAPYGYTAVGRKGDRHMEINEETARIVRQVFEWYVSGENGRPVTAAEIAKRLTLLGVPTPDDHVPNRHMIRKRAAGEWAKDSIYKILRHPAYSGVFLQFARARKGEHTHKTDPSTHVPVPVPAIVDMELWQAAQKKLDEGRTQSPRGAKYEYLMARRLTCQCSFKIRSETITTDYPVLYQYYVCPGRKGKIAYHACDMDRLNVQQVDQVVWEWVKEDIGQPEVLEQKLREIQERQRSENTNKDTALQALYARQATIEEELGRLCMLFARMSVPDKVATKLIDEQNQLLERINQEIAKVIEEGQAELSDHTVTILVEFSREFREDLEATKQTFERRRTVVDGLDVTAIVVRRDDGIWLKLRSILHPDFFWKQLNIAWC